MRKRWWQAEKNLQRWCRDTHSAGRKQQNEMRYSIEQKIRNDAEKNETVAQEKRKRQIYAVITPEHRVNAGER